MKHLIDNSKKKTVALVLVSILAIFSLFYPQILYISNGIKLKLNDIFNECSALELIVTDDEIIYEYRCNHLAYLSNFIVKSGKPLEINLYGKGTINLVIYKSSFGTRLNDNLVKSEIIEVNSDIPRYFSDKIGFANTKGDKFILQTDGFEPGWYQAKILSGGATLANLPFLIEPTYLANILFVQSTDTLIAYNKSFRNTGIPNNYVRSTSQKEKAPASFSKLIPLEYEIRDENKLSCGSHLINADNVIGNFLQKNGIFFSLVSDETLDDSSTFDGKDIIILGAHNEYWTQEKISNLETFVHEGGKLLILGGNNAYRAISRFDTHHVLRDDNFRDFNDDYFKNFDIGSYEKIYNLIGTFSNGDFGSSSHFKVTNADFLKNNFKIGVDKDMSFGVGTDFYHCYFPIAIGPFQTASGASGIEIDELVSDKNGFIVLASGQNKAGGADIVYKKFHNGGEVLNFSSVGLWHRLSDKTIQSLILEFLRSTTY